MARCVFIGLWVLACTSLFGQSYSNIAQQLGIVAVNVANEHGSGTSCVDFDQDGDDDLTFALDNAIRTYRNVNGSAQLIDFGFVTDNNVKHPVWVDYDNDGDLDFYFSQSLYPNKLYQNNNNEFVDVTEMAGLPSTHVSSFGCSWGDYDNDGDLDLFQCTYIYTYFGDDVADWHNHLYQNNGDGTFAEVTLEAGVSDGISLSFQSIWTDINNDGWLDLYVINDLEHPNRLYINNMDGTFAESAESWNASVSDMDAMTASVGDYNNDGWQDIFVTNTSIGQCALLKNTGVAFENVASVANVELNMLVWGATWFDADLDADLDLYVCENNYLSPQLPNPYLKNNGAGFFVNSASSSFPFDNNNSYSVASFDWNQDGRPDLAVNNYTPQNASVWKSNQPGLGWLKIDLSGVVSNRQGIGSRVVVWSQGIQQTKELYAGENYLGQNSNTLLFGLNGATVADSLHVYWPSGFVDKLYSIEANQVLQIEEGLSFSCSLAIDANQILCEGDSMLVTLTDVYELVEWNNGVESDSIWINETGEVYAWVQDEYGFEAISNTIVFSFDTLPNFDSNLQDVSCFGISDGAIELVGLPNPELIMWSNGQTGSVLDTIPSGDFIADIVSAYGCHFQVSYTVNQPAPLEIMVSTQPATCNGFSNGSVALEFTGGTSPFSAEWLEWDPNYLAAGLYEIAVIDSMGCAEWVTFEIQEPSELVLELISVVCEAGLLTVDIETSGGTEPYAWLWSNGMEQEDLSAPEGTYNLYVTDEALCVTSMEQISCSLGLDEAMGAELDIVIYPNPVSDVVWIYFPVHYIGKQVQVFNEIGQVHTVLQVTERKQLVSVANWPMGIYLIQGNRFAVLK